MSTSAMRRKYSFILLLSALLPLTVSQPVFAAEEQQNRSLLPSLSRLYGLFWPGDAEQRNKERLHSSRRNRDAAVFEYNALPGGITLSFGDERPPAVVGDAAKPAAAGPPEKYFGHYRATGTASAEIGDFYALSQIGYRQYGDDTARARTERQVILEAGTQRNALNTGVMYAYRTGHPAFISNKPVLGEQRLPYFIFSPATAGSGALGDSYATDVQAVLFYVGYDLTDQLTALASFGFAKTNKSDAADTALTEKGSRWSIDIAASYKLLDNLVYEAHLGYMNIDESAAAASSAVNDSGPSISPLKNPSDIYQITNKIRMTF